VALRAGPPPFRAGRAPCPAQTGWPGRLGAAGAALGSLLGLAWLGLRVPPAPFAAFSGAPPAAGRGSVPIPEDVPPPVLRYYRAVFAGGAVPVVDSAVLAGRGRLTIRGLTFPIRWRFLHLAGRAYRHRIEATWPGLPVFRVDEWYRGGRLRMETPAGVLAGDPLADRAANLALWAESPQSLPAALVTDARVRWEALDDTRARLVVPSGQEEGEDALTVTFDARTALVRVMEAPRYRAETRETLPWRVEADPSSARPFGGMRLATVSAVRWSDANRPWLTLTLEEAAFNADVPAAIQSSAR
jgi:hypothetical protein